MIVTLLITDLYVFYAHCSCLVVLTVHGKIDRVNGFNGINAATQLRHLTGALQGINTNAS